MIPERWKRDPLSGALTVSAALLLVMYGLETWRSSQVDESEQRVARLSAPDGCRLSSAGLRGETLVIHCPSIAASAIDATRFASVPFDHIVGVGSDLRTQLR